MGFIGSLARGVGLYLAYIARKEGSLIFSLEVIRQLSKYAIDNPAVPLEFKIAVVAASILILHSQNNSINANLKSLSEMHRDYRLLTITIPTIAVGMLVATNPVLVSSAPFLFLYGILVNIPVGEFATFHRNKMEDALQKQSRQHSDAAEHMPPHRLIDVTS